MTQASLQKSYQGKSVFVTGQTGFKGSWLCWWLHQLGADVSAYALPPTDARGNHFVATGLGSAIHSHYGDIRDADALTSALQDSNAEIVFHLAAQPFVRASYDDPVFNYDTNVMGTIHLLEAVRKCPSVKSVIVITTDKCYENIETMHPYDETDRLGGHDPYSASKAMAEIATNSYRLCFLDKIGLASARAGNVLGGGDFGDARLVPDIIEAVQKNEIITLRNPNAIRPWQHVLDVLHGYLLLGAQLQQSPEAYSTAYNFSPPAADEQSVNVEQLAALTLKAVGRPEHPLEIIPSELHEATLLRLNPEKAKRELGWQTLLSMPEAIEWSAQWYRAVSIDQTTAARDMTLSQLERFTRLIDTANAQVA